MTETLGQTAPSKAGTIYEMWTESINNKRIGILIGVSLILIAAIFRATAVLWTEVEGPIRADAIEYYSAAFNLKNYGVYSSDFKTIQTAVSETNQPVFDSTRPPGFPLVASIFMQDTLSTISINRVLYFQTLLSVVSVAIIYFTINYLAGWPLAAVVGSLSAISPHLINVNVYFLSESITIFTIALFACLVALGVRRQSVALIIAGGFALGYSAITRQFIQYFFLLAWIPFLFLPVSNSTKKRYVIGLTIPALIFPLIWLIVCSYNDSDSSDLRKKYSIAHGMYPNMMYKEMPESFGFPYRSDPNNASITKNLETVKQEVKRRFTEEPARHIKWYLWGKPLTLWSGKIIAGQGGSFIYPTVKSPYFSSRPFIYTHLFMDLIHNFITIIAFFTCVIVWLPINKFLSKSTVVTLRIFSLLLLYTTAIHIVAAPFPRYSIPLRPIIYLFFGTGMYLIGAMAINFSSSRRLVKDGD